MRATFKSSILWTCAFAVLTLQGSSLWAEDPVALFEAGRFDEARTAFFKRLAAQPGDAEALYYLGRLTAEGGKSRGYFARLLAAHPAHALADDALFELAEADYADPAGLYMTARRRYRQLLASYPDSPLAPRALYRIGMTYLVMRQPDSASVALQEALSRFPDSETTPYVRLGIVEAKAQQGDASEALRVAEALLEGDAGPVKAAMLERVAALRKQVGRTSDEDRREETQKGGRFWVQVGAFGNRDNLGRLSARLVEAGLQVREEAVGESALRLLLTGPFADREAAEAARKRIETAEKLTCQVKKRAEE